jgi:hypothetical protein
MHAVSPRKLRQPSAGCANSDSKTPGVSSASRSATVITLLADVNVQGHVARLIALMQGPYWRELWDHLQIRSVAFQDIGISPDDTDAHVWEACQQQQLYLLTNNRNDDGPDSLEATIRARSSPENIPVFTFADADSILHDRDYAERVIESLYDYLLRIDSVRGTGRLFLP